jgi:hypothetical protein
MNAEIVSAESAEVLLEDRIDALDADRLARSVIALHAEVARLQKLLDENVEDRVRAHEILGGAEYESTADAAARVVQNEVSASVEAGRLLAIVAGRTTPPTDAEIYAHDARGGAWLVTMPPRAQVRMTPETRYTSDPAEVSRLWWSEGAWWVPVLNGRPCAWPTGLGSP